MGQGVMENLFKTEYPGEIAEIILVAMNFLLDPSLFSWNADEFSARLKAMQDIFETALRIEKGTLSFLYSGFADLIEQHNRSVES